MAPLSRGKGAEEDVVVRMRKRRIQPDGSPIITGRILKFSDVEEKREVSLDFPLELVLGEYAGLVHPGCTFEPLPSLRATSPVLYPSSNQSPAIAASEPASGFRE